MAIAPYVGRVVAADVSPAMLAFLRRRIAATHLDNVRVVEAGFMSYRHDGAPADVAYTRNALHQIPDFHKGVALARIAGFLRPGGTLFLRDLVYDFDPGEAEEAIPAWFAGAVAVQMPFAGRGSSPERSRTLLATGGGVFEAHVRGGG